ncbi:hypothetical protein JCM10369A_09080 [Nocardioides pyridinolyticus]
MSARNEVAQRFAERLDQRRERMRAELEQEDVPILGGARYPDKLAGEAATVDAILLEEIIYARHAPVHEGLRPRYGCVLVADLGEVGADEKSALREIVHHDVWSIRPMVDGSSTMLVRDLTGRLGIIPVEVEDELALVDFLSRMKGVSVQRLADGRLRIGTRAGIALNDGGDWSLRPATGSVIRSLTGELALPDGSLSRLERMREIGRLLELCYHGLSPNGIGATIVVNLSGEAADLFEGTSDEGAVPAMALNVFRREDQVLLRNMLAYEDGACLVDADGGLARYASKLKFSDKAVDVASEHGGSRHTSAKRFSFDHPGALAVVVSADGPITLFCGGSALARIDASTARPSWLSTSSTDVRMRVENANESVSCARCGTSYRVSLVLDEETGTRVEVNCVVCDEVVISRDGVLDCRPRVVRPWEEQ